MKKLAVVCLFLCGCVLLAGAALGEDTPKMEKVFKATVDSDGVQRVDILGGSYFFAPNRVIVKVNVPVEMKVRKEAGVVPHNIVIKAPEAGIDFNVSMSNEPKTVKFTPKKTGKYPFYCDKKPPIPFTKNHRAKGMEGTLEVIE